MYFAPAQVRDPAKRASISQLLGHPWIRRFCPQQRAMADHRAGHHDDMRLLRGNSMPLNLTHPASLLPVVPQVR